MKARKAALLLSAILCCVAGSAQSKPSITIGGHVLTLGMQESSVLQQLGSDLKLTSIWSNPSGSGWGVSTNSGTVDQTLGSVNFDASHHLASAKRSWEMDDPSTKSPLDAVGEAVKSLEGDQFTSCPVYQATADAGSGSPSSKDIVIDCGIKQISIHLAFSGAKRMTPSSIEVAEVLKSK